MSGFGDPVQPDTETTRRTVFVSYASADAGIAEQACAALEAAGVPCWIAPRDVRPGDPYAAAIVEAIN
ncbi:MAG: toll/interleukin-1 receptor domain-containing protein, partial [Steroidobacteraceae bacterium]